MRQLTRMPLTQKRPSHPVWNITSRTIFAMTNHVFQQIWKKMKIQVVKTANPSHHRPPHLRRNQRMPFHRRSIIKGRQSPIPFPNHVTARQSWKRWPTIGRVYLVSNTRININIHVFKFVQWSQLLLQGGIKQMSIMMQVAAAAMLFQNLRGLYPW